MHTANEVRISREKADELRATAINDILEDINGELLDLVNRAIESYAQQGLYYAVVRYKIEGDEASQVKALAFQEWYKGIDWEELGFNVQRAKVNDQGENGLWLDLCIDWSWESKFHLDSRKQEPNADHQFADWFWEGELQDDEIERIQETTNWVLEPADGGFTAKFKLPETEVPA